MARALLSYERRGGGGDKWTQGLDQIPIQAQLLISTLTALHCACYVSTTMLSLSHKFCHVIVTTL